MNENFPKKFEDVPANPEERMKCEKCSCPQNTRLCTKDCACHSGVKNGRPFTYGPEILTNTQKYIDECEDQEYRLVVNDGEKSTSYENKLRVKLPSIEGLAFYLKISRKCLYLWEEEYPEFADLMEDLRVKQANFLMNNGLSGDYNSTIAKLILSKHGYVDKNETDLTSKGEKVASINYIVPKNPAEVEADKKVEEKKQDGNNTPTELETAPGVADPGGQGNH